MSVHKRGKGWQVKYRLDGRQRALTFDLKGDADKFDREVRRRSQLGPALVRELDRSAMTLDGFVRGPWRAHAATLSPASRARSAWALERHLADLLDLPLVALDVPALAAHQRRMLDRGATPSTVRSVLTVLSGVLQIAVEYGHLPSNPARALRKVRAEPTEEARPLPPVVLEGVLARLEGRDRAIALLGGHLGLRPQEIRTAPWSALAGSTFTVGRARTKATARRTRVLTVPEVTARELRTWRMAAGRPADHEPIIGPMTANAMKLWSRRVLRPAVAAAGGQDDATVYTLRHSHASALHYAGLTPPEAAARMGHGLALHWKTYAHVIEALSGQRYADLDGLIAAARAELMFPGGSQQVQAGS